ncbi:MAG TPA: rRNA pseudouridine synthase [Chloroflexi bacterium]|nr:MAG: pseudouridine synthase [Chloroflexota bacterium]HDD54980.1 rRNA pseudouridine synthase [Chloroflexota bacterium]
MEIRLQKILAQAGYGSRRKCEDLIAQERVAINGTIATLGMKADPERDTITIDQIPINEPETKLYILLHKPKGVLSTVSTPDRRPTVRSLVDLPGRFYPVGRLDLHSEGLILLTNDGVLTHQLTHPSFEHEKEYRVQVTPPPRENQLAAWRKGMFLEKGELTRPAKVWIEHQEPESAWLGVILKEGKKRQIRRMAESSGLHVRRLIRIRMANLTLGDLLPGEWRKLHQNEIIELKNLLSDRG